MILLPLIQDTTALQKGGLEGVVRAVTDTPASELAKQLVSAGIRFGLKVIAALLIFLIGAWVIKRIRKLIERGLKKKSTDVAVTSFVGSLAGVVLWGLLIVLTVSALGVDTTSIAALLAAGGMALGMALGGTVQNFAGGVMLLIFKPFKVGDFIKAQGESGTVVDMNIVSTRIRTIDNRIVILPHGPLSNGNIDNYTANPIRRVEWTFDVEYGTDAESVKAEVLAILSEDGRILDSSVEGAVDPVVVIKELRDSGVQFMARAWVNTPDYWQVYYDFNSSVYERLPRKGVSFAFPQLDVHVKN